MLGGCASKRGSDSEGTKGSRERSASVVTAEPVEGLQLVRGNDEALKRGGVVLVKDEAALQAMAVQSIEGLSANWAEQDVVILSLLPGELRE